VLLRHVVETSRAVAATSARREKIGRLADKFGLLKTGGSDFHGSNKSQIQLGAARGRKIPREMFDALTARVGRNANGAKSE